VPEKPKAVYPRTLNVFTLEVAGRPLLSFEASSAKEAAELLKERWFRDELRERKSAGQPLWDGAAGIRARPASIEEAGRYREMADEAGDEAGDLFLAFWVTLDGRAARQTSGTDRWRATCAATRSALH
jgi:hypothetical protein